MNRRNGQREDPPIWDDLDRELAAVVRDMVAKAAENGSAHPEPEQLVAFFERELPPEKIRLIEDHLGICPECGALVDDLHALETDPNFGIGQWPSPERSEAMWEQVSRRRIPDRPGVADQPGVAEEEPAEEEPAEKAEGAKILAFRDRWKQTTIWLGAIAASLLLAVGALSYRVTELRGTVAELDRPRANVEVFYPDPGKARRGGSGEARSFVLPARWAPFVLSLPAPVLSSFEGATCRLELITEGGATALAVDGLVPKEDGTLAVLVPRSRVAPGSYRIDLYQNGAPGESPGATPPAASRTPVDQYRVTFVEGNREGNAGGGSGGGSAETP